MHSWMSITREKIIMDTQERKRPGRPPTKNPKYNQLSVRINKELYDEFRKLAHLEFTYMGSIAYAAIVERIDDLRKKHADRMSEA